MSKLSDTELVALRDELIELSQELRRLSETGESVSADLASHASDVLERYFHSEGQDYELREKQTHAGQDRAQQRRDDRDQKLGDADQIRQRVAKIRAKSPKKSLEVIAGELGTSRTTLSRLLKQK